MLINYTLLEAKENIKFTIVTFPTIYKNFLSFLKKSFQLHLLKL